MDIPSKYKGRSFYHFTHVDNIESIVENGILCTNEKNKRGIGHINIANENIQNRRSEMNVTCEPYGKVHDYVPFYFTARNPMLLGILKRKNIDQPLVVYIAISIEKLLEKDVIFTDKSANTAIPPNFYQNPDELDNLSWNLIDNKKWKEENNDDLHSRMAEVLVHKRVPIEWIESYVVFNEICKDKIEEIYEKAGLKKPKISYEPYGGKYFYFTKLGMQGREKETLIAGPRYMNKMYKEVTKEIINKRENNMIKDGAFENIEDAILKIKENFCVIDELEGIYNLETSNKEHNKNVSNHTLQVVDNLEENEYYNELNKKDKAIVKLAAYLHDIGKGPKSKWKDGIQPTYDDHPADSMLMIMRILTEEFNTISEYEIQKICFLVFYHDLIGDIINKGRSKEELLNLEVDENELNMLIALTIADVSAINSWWTYKLESALPQFKEEILENDRVCIR